MHPFLIELTTQITYSSLQCFSLLQLFLLSFLSPPNDISNDYYKLN